MKEKVNILIVNDQTSADPFIKTLCRDAALNVTVVHSSVKAIQLLTNSIDLILLDIVIPNVFDFEILRQIKVLNLSTKTIFTSVLAEEAAVYKAISLGASCYFCKPFDFERVISTIKSLTV